MPRTPADPPVTVRVPPELLDEAKRAARTKSASEAIRAGLRALVLGAAASAAARAVEDELRRAS